MRDSIQTTCKVKPSPQECSVGHRLYSIQVSSSSNAQSCVWCDVYGQVGFLDSSRGTWFCEAFHGSHDQAPHYLSPPQWWSCCHCAQVVALFLCEMAVWTSLFLGCVSDSRHAICVYGTIRYLVSSIHGKMWLLGEVCTDGEVYVWHILFRGSAQAGVTSGG